jgi:hypothetical protein
MAEKIAATWAERLKKEDFGVTNSVGALCSFRFCSFDD